MPSPSNLGVLTHDSFLRAYKNTRIEKMPQRNEPGDWSQYSVYILRSIQALERSVDAVRGDINRRCDRLEKDANNIKIEVATLKTRASVWGAVAGFIFGAVVSLISKKM